MIRILSATNGRHKKSSHLHQTDVYEEEEEEVLQELVNMGHTITGRLEYVKPVERNGSRAGQRQGRRQ